MAMHGSTARQKRCVDLKGTKKQANEIKYDQMVLLESRVCMAMPSKFQRKMWFKTQFDIIWSHLVVPYFQTNPNPYKACAKSLAPSGLCASNCSAQHIHAMSGSTDSLWNTLCVNFHSDVPFLPANLVATLTSSIDIRYFHTYPLVI